MCERTMENEKDDNTTDSDLRHKGDKRNDRKMFQKKQLLLQIFLKSKTFINVILWGKS